ncbi:MAG: hypothetical protein I4O51_12185 [Flavobacterium micromati]|nr:hypothetical protein [Flavobacterium micromati]
MKKNLLIFCFLMAILLSCTNKKTISNDSVQNDTIITILKFSKADSIIDKTIEAHGGKLYLTADYSFIFREKNYRFQNNGGNFKYTSEIKKGDSVVKDILTPAKFERFINDKLQRLNKEQTGKYSEALNSVIYFVMLPYKLQDASVNKEFVEESTIKGKKYDAIGVTFGKDGGGKDFDDEYQYWINKDTHKVDYLAYNYHVNDGGVRFRVAINTRVIAGVTFQDFINYEAPVKTPLKDLPKLYEQGKLKKVSQILSENIVNNHK